MKMLTTDRRPMPAYTISSRMSLLLRRANNMHRSLEVSIWHLTSRPQILDQGSTPNFHMDLTWRQNVSRCRNLHRNTYHCSVFKLKICFAHCEFKLRIARHTRFFLFRAVSNFYKAVVDKCLLKFPFHDPFLHHLGFLEPEMRDSIDAYACVSIFDELPVFRKHRVRIAFKMTCR